MSFAKLCVACVGWLATTTIALQLEPSSSLAKDLGADDAAGKVQNVFGGSEPAFMRTSFWEHARSQYMDKTVNVAVGIFHLEARDPQDIWIEFDPTNDALVETNRLLMPYIASAQHTDSAPFYIQESGGCCSTLRPSGAESNKSRYTEHANYACDKILSATNQADWKVTDHNVTSKAAAERGIAGVFACQDPRSVTETKVFPSLHLGEFLFRLAPSRVDWLEIDAQGLDVQLVKALGEYTGVLQKVQNIKLECQRDDYWPPYAPPVWIYESISGGRNSCSEVQHFLEAKGFELNRLEINNCAAAEFNLFMQRAQ